MELLIATTNTGKIREFREMLGGDRRAWRDLQSLSRAGEAPVEETGRTFRANASLKAAEYAKRYHFWTVADDSGLEVDALEGRPGVFSARWARMNGAGDGDADNNALLLRQMSGIAVEQRVARFVCALALSDPTGCIILTVQEQVEGRILSEPRGANGFGYDPLFFVPRLGRTTAELEPGEKHAISHRGKALRRLAKLLNEYESRLPLAGATGATP